MSHDRYQISEDQAVDLYGYSDDAQISRLSGHVYPVEAALGWVPTTSFWSRVLELQRDNEHRQIFASDPRAVASWSGLGTEWCLCDMPAGSSPWRRVAQAA